jgi:enoyl-CoA hydratase/carnithine racemase
MSEVLVGHDARGVAIVTIDNAAKLNALSTSLMQSLFAAAEALGRDPLLRAVVLRGAGDRAFIGGADIGEMAGLDPASARDFITHVHRSCDVFRRLPVPVIARIPGFTFGAGLEVAASCDIRVASTEAAFGMPEVRLGVPSVVEAALLPQLIGWGRTRHLLLTGDTIDATTAERWGLVEHLVPPEELDATIERILASILASGPQAVRLQKALITDWEDLPLRDAVQRGVDCFATAWQGEEPRRMMQEFLDQRRRHKLDAARTEKPA